MFTHEQRPETTATLNVEAAGQMYSQTNECVCLVGDVNNNADLYIEAISGSIPLNCTADQALPLSSNFDFLGPRYSRQYYTAALCGARARATTTRSVEPSTVPDLLHRLVK